LSPSSSRPQPGHPAFAQARDASGLTAVLRMVWYALLLAAPVIVLIPFQDDSGLKTAGWLNGYIAGVAVQLYDLIKVAILWLVPGMLFSLMMPRPAIQRWAVVVAAGCFLTGWVIAPAMGWNEVKEILFALPGLAAGVWIGERSLRSEHSGAAAIGAQGGAIGPAAAVSEPRSLASHQPAAAGIAAPSKGVQVAGRAAGLILVGAALITLIDFPDWRIAIALGLAAYAAVLMLRPLAWLIVIPAALPLLDLAPWTGRFFWDEFDLLMLITLAVALWRGRFRLSAWTVPKLGALLALFVMFWGVSLLVGLFPLQPLDANAFSAYWSHYNSLRLSKGLLWGLVFYGLYRSQPEGSGAFTKLSFGMALGVLGVSLWVLWEQALFAGAATTTDYRVTAGFSSMHTGGGHIEAYLVIALPFVWGLFFLLRNPLYRALAGVNFLLGAYALFFTVSRGGVIALSVALVILLLGTWLARRKVSRHRIGFAVPLGMAALTLIVMAAGLSSDFWKQRLEQTADDAGIRFHHWAEVLSMRDSGVMTALFGQGVGTLPAVNLASQLPDKVGSYRYVSEGNNTFLTLNSAGTLYMAQRVVPHPGENLRLEISVRAPSTQAGLEASLCEKILFNSRQCQWLKVDVKTGNQDWQHHTQTFNSGEVGAGNVLTRRPVQFSLYNPVPGTLVEIDNVRLLDERGEDLLKNGDFSKGGDFWFFKSGDHLFWHIKNLWVHLLFEQGWLGVVLFSMIMMLALVRLLRAVGQGHVEATVMLAVLGAWATVGIVDSLVDAPRLALLVYGLLFISAAWGAAPRSSAKHGKRSRRHHRRHDSSGAALPA
jgi:hypothetical protein